MYNYMLKSCMGSKLNLFQLLLYISLNICNKLNLCLLTLTPVINTWKKGNIKNLLRVEAVALLLGRFECFLNKFFTRILDLLMNWGKNVLKIFNGHFILMKEVIQVFL